MRKIPLTILAYEGPSVRAYLSRLRHAGLVPQRILRLVLQRHPVTGKPVGRWLPRGLRVEYAQGSQEWACNFWPRRIRAAHPRLVETMTKEIARLCPEAPRVIEEGLGRFAYEEYAGEVERVFVEGLQDPALREACARLAPAVILFTGGGILPDRLLGVPGLRFLHVHPGCLPEVRGADGVLWSTLVRGRPGVSCFSMARGIDVGDVIAAEELPPVHFDLTHQPRPDDRTLYRAIFSFYDPMIRAEFFVRRVLSLPGDLLTLPGTPQARGTGCTYHFMHPLLRHQALRQLFQS